MYKVRKQALFDNLLRSVDQGLESFLGYSQAEALTLDDFKDDLNSNISLDWNGVSFQGLPLLRDHILFQADLKSRCKIDDVLITAGAAEANYLALRQILNPGDEMIVESPGWPQAEVIGSATGANIKKIFRLEKESWHLPIEKLEQSISPKTKMIFLTNPNNPTGKKLSSEEINQIAHIAEKNGIWVLIDEVYAGLEWDNVRSTSIAGIYHRGISTGSVSKAFGMQGLRIGWIICQDQELIHDALVLREYSSQISNHLGELIAEIALRPIKRAAFIEKIKASSLINLNILTSFIESNSLLSWYKPEAGLIGLVRLHENSELNGDSIADIAQKPPFNTFLISGSVYEQPQHIRLGVGGGQNANLETGLSKLKLIIDNPSLYQKN